jgi:hypothetical protein
MDNFTIMTKDNIIIKFDINKKQVFLFQHINEYIIYYVIIFLLLYYNLYQYINNFNILLKFKNSKYKIEYNNINKILQEIKKINKNFVIDNNILFLSYNNKNYKIILYLYNDIYESELQQYLQIKIEYADISLFENISNSIESSIPSLSTEISSSLSSLPPPPPPPKKSLAIQPPLKKSLANQPLPKKSLASQNGLPDTTNLTVFKGGKKQKSLKKFK